MGYTFTPEQQAAITSLRLAVEADPTRRYAEVYQYIADILFHREEVLLGSGNHVVWNPSLADQDSAIREVALWFAGAAEVNAEEGLFSTLIREYTSRQKALRDPGWSLLSLEAQKDEIQDASNQVAFRALNDLVQRNWVLPTLDQIADSDAIGTGQILFSDALFTNDSANPDGLNSAWSGALLFSMLDIPLTPNGETGEQTNRLLGGDETFNTVSDFRDLLFAYDAFVHAFEQSSDQWTSATTDDVSIGIQTYFLDPFLANPFDAESVLDNMTNGDMADSSIDYMQTFGRYELFDKLAAVFGTQFDSPTSAANFVDRALPLFDSLRSNGQLSLYFDSFDGTEDLAGMANQSSPDGSGYRYALVNLNPFVVIGDEALYTPHNQNGELDLYNETTHEGTLTPSYLADRARFLVLLTERNLTDASVAGEAIEFFDKTTGEIAQYDNAYGGDRSRYHFGGDDADALQGGNNSDHLYGGSGNDTLIGNGGADHLEGGEGDDTYLAGDGDTILDTDGFGRVLFGDTVLFGGVRYEGDPAGVFTSRDGTVTYRLEGGSLTVSYGASSLVIDQFQDLDLGIHLEESTVPGDPTATILGTADNDNGLDTDTNADPLIGTPGNDHIDAQAGLDILHGREGDDLLEGGADTDILIGGLGSDRLHAGTKADSDSIVAGQGSALTGDALSGQSGDDTLHGSHGEDYLAGGGGEDVIYAGGGDDLIYGDSDRVVAGFEWFDVDGTFWYALDTIGYTWNSTLRVTLPGLAGALNPVDSANDLIYAGDGNDTVWGQAGDDVIYGEGGDDRLEGDLAASGASHLPGEYHGNDFIFGGTGDDSLAGNGGSDWLLGGEGNDWLEGDFRVVLAGDLPYHGDDYLDGGSGSDTLIGEGGSDVLIGGADNDFLYGDLSGLDAAYHGNDALFGGDGDDQLLGYGGNDYLNGGKGVDYLDGGTGADTYFFVVGDGLVVDNVSDTIFDTAGEGNRIELSADISPDAVSIIQVGDNGDLVLQYNWTNAIYVNGGLTGSIDAYSFGSSGFTAYQDVLMLYVPDAHYLNGDAGDDLVFGGAGDDLLQAGAGKDTLHGGDGDDTLFGGEANDALIGGTGNDTLDGGAGSDVYRFGTGQGQDVVTDASGYDALQFNDVLHADLTFAEVDSDLIITQGTDSVTIRNWQDGTVDQIQFANGEVTTLGDALTAAPNFGAARTEANIVGGGVEGTAGNDDFAVRFVNNSLVIGGGYVHHDVTLRGGAGDDTYRLSINYPATIVDDATGDNTLVIEGDPAAALYLNRLGDDLVVVLDGAAVARLQNGALHLPARIVTPAGESLTGAAVTARVNTGPTPGAAIDPIDVAEGTALNWTVPLTAFVDTDDAALQLSARLANGDLLPTWLSFDPQTGTLSGTPADTDAGSLVLKIVAVDKGGLRAETTLALNVTDATHGGSGNDTLTGTGGDDQLTGGSGDDVLFGGDGADTLDGGIGNDTLAGGTGSDTYLFGAGHGTDRVDNTAETGPKLDRVVFDASIDRVAVSVTREGDDLLIQTSATDSLRLIGYFTGETANGTAVEQIAFDDGTVWGIEDVKGMVLQPSAGDDLITGYASDDVLSGLAGKDTLVGLGGNDILSGGEGDDTLEGGHGNDTITGGTGNDTYLFGAGHGNDRIENAAESGPKLDRILFDASIDRTAVGVKRDGDDLLIQTSATDSLRLAGYFTGEAANGTAVEQIVFDDGTVWGIEDIKSMVLQPSAGNDLITGYASDDVLSGLAGNDTLRGLGGNDRLSGGDGIDTLTGGIGDDQLAGDAGNDWLEGGSGNDTLAGGMGNDYLDGGTGADRYLFARGDGQDMVVDAFAEGMTIDVAGAALTDLVFRRDGTTLQMTFLDSPGDQLSLNAFFANEMPLGSIRLQHGIGQETLLSPAELRQFTLEGTAYADLLRGYTGNDLIEARGGNDAVFAGEGNDILDGGTGNDKLEGGAGNDQYRLAAGWGDDLVLDSAGTDSLQFAGVAPTDLLLRRDGANLVVTHRGTGDRLRVMGQFSNLAGVAGVTPIEQVVFGDGTTWDVEAIMRKVLEGTAQDDTIYGHADDDVIDAAAGNDLVQAGGGNDTVSGGDGYDTLEGGAGNDTLSGGIGNDILRGIDGDDQLFGDAGDDLLEGAWGNDTLYGGDGQDVLSGGGGYDLLHGEAGNDTLQGEGLLDGGSGDDLLEGSGLLIGGDGMDTLRGQGFDTLQGGAGDDVLEAYSSPWDQGTNTLEGGAGNDTLYGAFGEDTYVFNLGDGQDLLIERRPDQAYSNIAPTADTLSFGAGIVTSDLSFLRRGTDLIIGHANGIDSITVQNWFQEPTDHFKLEHFLFADGSALSQTEVESRVVYEGTAGTDSFLGYRTLDDTMRLGEGDDQAWGRVGNDMLNGEAGNDYLEGEAGDDTLYGGFGNDHLDGGAGSDLLSGGAGDDKYVYAPGDGSDTIDNAGGGHDGVFFTGIGADRLNFSREGEDLLVRVDGDAAQTVRVRDHFLGGDQAISYVQPDGGYLLDAARIGQMVAAQGVPGAFETLIDGTAAGEQLVGYAGRDLLRGQGGGDTLFGMGGNDQLEGGDGNDYLSGGNGIQTGSGNDVLTGGNGNDILLGEDGDDTLAGGAGDDAYYYRANDGVDVIDNSGGGFDGVHFLNGVGPSRLSFHRDGNDLVILVDQDLGQQVRVTDHFLGGDHAIDYVQPDGGSYRTGAQIASLLTTLPGSSGGDPGDPGDPGNPSDPVVTPIPGVGGDDVLIGTGGTDILLGGAGNDTLDGGTGNDRLLGGEGDDTYVYTAGQVILEEVGAGNDTLSFANGITFDQVASGLMKSGNDLILRVNASSANQVTLKDFFLGGENLVEIVTFETGGQITASQIFGAFGLLMPTASPVFDATIDGSTGNDAALGGTSQRDLVRGFNGDDQLFGDARADRLEGGNGNDTLDGGTDNDTLVGGRGDDTYVFTAGGGEDVIDNSGGGVDTLRFEGIGFSQVASGLMKSGNDLILNVSGGGDKVTIKNWFLGGDYVVDTITFVSGGQITAAQLFDTFGLANLDLIGSPAYQNLPDDRAFGTILSGQVGDQIVFGSSDADLIDGGAGADTLSGNAGNDYLLGGDGSDTYLFAAGDGQDTLNNLSNVPGADTDVLGIENIAREDLWLSRQGDDLLLDVIGSVDRIAVQGWYANPAQQLDLIQANGSVLYASAVDNLVNAMAVFGAPAGGEINLTPTEREQLDVVIATNWQ